MFSSILVVCTGNICRSPAAEAALRVALGPDGPTVSSAGTSGLVGEPADAVTRTVAAEAGLDLSGHRARQVTAPLLAQQDLVLVMEQAHADWIHAHHPVMRGRVQLLGRWREAEVPDPYGRPEEAHRAALDLIRACVEDWRPRLG